MSNRSDNFTRANSTTTINPPSDGGSNWTVYVGTWGIISNLAYTPNGDAGATVAMDSTTSDVDVQVTLGTPANDEGLLARSTDDNNYILFQFKTADNTLHLFKRVAGTFTELTTSVSSTIAGNDVFKLSVTGTSLKCYQNGTLKLSATDGAGQTNTKHGMRCNSSNASRFSTFSITDNNVAAAVTGWEDYVISRKNSRVSYFLRDTEPLIPIVVPGLQPYFETVDAPHVPRPLVIPY